MRYEPSSFNIQISSLTYFNNYVKTIRLQICFTMVCRSSTRAKVIIVHDATKHQRQYHVRGGFICSIVGRFCDGNQPLQLVANLIYSLSHIYTQNKSLISDYQYVVLIFYSNSFRLISDRRFIDACQLYAQYPAHALNQILYSL